MMKSGSKIVKVRLAKAAVDRFITVYDWLSQSICRKNCNYFLILRRRIQIGPDFGGHFMVRGRIGDGMGQPGRLQGRGDIPAPGGKD
jgi:hypothetical protein